VLLELQIWERVKLLLTATVSTAAGGVSRYHNAMLVPVAMTLQLRRDNQQLASILVRMYFGFGTEE
jgi:hypothetical protein